MTALRDGGAAVFRTHTQGPFHSSERMVPWNNGVDLFCGLMLIFPVKILRGNELMDRR